MKDKQQTTIEKVVLKQRDTGKEIILESHSGPLTDERVCEIALELDDADIQVLIGDYFYSDYKKPWSEKNDSKKDYEKSAIIYKSAAEKGHAQAQYLCGLSYFLGDGVKKNLDEALKWFAKAAEQNYVEAYYFMGVCYEKKKKSRFRKSYEIL